MTIGEKVWHKKDMFLGDAIIQSFSKSGRSAYLLPQRKYYQVKNLEVL